MKIRKFNESWTKNKLVDFFKQNDDFKIKKNEIENLIYEFFFMNLHYISEPDLKNAFERDILNIEWGRSIDVFLEFKDNQLEVEFTWDDGDESETLDLYDQLLDDIIDFINDPDTYKAAKKYNL